MSVQEKKFSDICQDDLKVNAIRLNFGLDTCQIKVEIVQVNTKSAQRMSDIHTLYEQFGGSCIALETMFSHRTKARQ